MQEHIFTTYRFSRVSTFSVLFSVPEPSEAWAAIVRLTDVRGHSQPLTCCFGQEVEEVMLEEPCGWLTVPLTRKDLSPSEDDTEPMRDCEYLGLLQSFA